MRLGDIIDDYCSRCKLATDHSVVSMQGEEASKVRCRTCNHEHNYRHNKNPHKEMSKQEAFHRVLASVTDSQPDSSGTKSKAKNKIKSGGRPAG
jgi:hypothetical protein